MKRQNSIWGALRISQEIKLLSISIHKKTVQRILKEFGFTRPKLKFHSPSWSSLIKNQKNSWAMDFTCIFDRFGNQLFILVIIKIVSKELALINVTQNPTRHWIIQQFRNIAISGHTFPSHLITGKDGIYGKWIERELKEEFGINIKRIPKGKPWQNGTCERFHLTIKNEVLNRITVVNLSHTQSLCAQFQEYYNRYRPHQSLDGKPPCDYKEKKSQFEAENIRKVRQVDGMITRFELAA